MYLPAIPAAHASSAVVLRATTTDLLRGRNGVCCIRTGAGWQGWARRGLLIWGEQDVSLHHLTWRLLLLANFRPQDLEEISDKRGDCYVLAESTLSDVPEGALPTAVDRSREMPEDWDSDVIR